MKKIKIKFVDFWYGFLPDKNYFFAILSSNYIVELSDDPDILIFSCFGSDHLKYTCTRLFFSAENIRPNFKACDYAITFDYNENARHYRLPLYALYIDQTDSLQSIMRERTKAEALQIWRNKTGFCCMVVSNGSSLKRLQFFDKLSEYKKVDSGGLVLNNVGGPVKDKMEFIKDYRFVIAFENSSHPGYTTEKLIEPLIVDCIPLYWGDPLVYNEFNPSCFLNLDESKSFKSFIDEIKEIDNNEDKAISMIMENKFAGNKVPNSINKLNLNLFLDKIVQELDSITPIGKTWTGKLNYLNFKFKKYLGRIKSSLRFLKINL